MDRRQEAEGRGGGVGDEFVIGLQINLLSVFFVLLPKTILSLSLAPQLERGPRFQAPFTAFGVAKHIRTAVKTGTFVQGAFHLGSRLMQIATCS